MRVPPELVVNVAEPRRSAVDGHGVVRDAITYGAEVPDDVPEHHVAVWGKWHVAVLDVPVPVAPILTLIMLPVFAAIIASLHQAELLFGGCYWFIQRPSVWGNTESVSGVINHVLRGILTTMSRFQSG